MNPNTATIRSIEIQQILGCSDQSVYRWFAPDYPVHVTHTRGRCYALPEVVNRIRAGRHKGLKGADLGRVCGFDTSVRATAHDEFLWLGNNTPHRAKNFLAVLDGDELERAKACVSETRRAFIRNGLTGIQRISESAVIHPAVVRYVLTNQGDELPIGDKGWDSWARAIFVVNPPIMETEVA